MPYQAKPFGEAGCCVRQNRVVLTPRRWRQVSGGRVGQTNLNPLATVTKKPDRRGGHDISRKTIARGMPGDSGVTVVTSCALPFYIAHEPSVTGLEESIPFCVIRLPGTCFCSGSAQGRRLMGFMRGTGRPICGKRDHIVGCVDNSRDGLAWSIVPAKGLRFGESPVWWPARKPVCLRVFRPLLAWQPD